MNIRQDATQPNAVAAHEIGDAVILCASEEARDAIVHWYASLPARAIIAGDGYQASRLLQDRAFTVLITDRLLPPWPGLDTFRVLRERNPDLRVVFVESGSLDDRILAGVTGATDFLPKPLTRDGLLQALSRGPTPA